MATVAVEFLDAPLLPSDVLLELTASSSGRLGRDVRTRVPRLSPRTQSQQISIRRMRRVPDPLRCDREVARMIGRHAWLDTDGPPETSHGGHELAVLVGHEPRVQPAARNRFGTTVDEHAVPGMLDEQSGGQEAW